ncbi:nitric oxide synthase oxygenase [Actinoalloteichus caeruleus]|uniref:nitric oxide synthase oxygenase n=1 Tax=Actinoalloteichus cyanogriseus TaxID=2893586 RepID=UPI00068D5636|nr:nitric oxide synthase oxygenase [Actinoalloteichus caeruleus]
MSASHRNSVSSPHRPPSVAASRAAVGAVVRLDHPADRPRAGDRGSPSQVTPSGGAFAGRPRRLLDGGGEAARDERVVAEAVAFLRLHHAGQTDPSALSSRVDQVRREVARTGTYTHTGEELRFGAWLALRESGHCPPGVGWRDLVVRDLRVVRDPAGVAAGCADHLRTAVVPPSSPAGRAGAGAPPPSGGQVRPVVTVFGPDLPGEPAARVHNLELVGYAGYERSGGAVVGDARHVGITRSLGGLGWRRPLRPGRFDQLPLAIASGGASPMLFDVPRDAVYEVPLEHPECDWFPELGLRWHATRAVTGLALRVGGVVYPAAPFNTPYGAWEIAARLGAAAGFGAEAEVASRWAREMDAAPEPGRGLEELERAVGHSFAAAGVGLAGRVGPAERRCSRLRAWRGSRGPACFVVEPDRLFALPGPGTVSVAPAPG